MKKIKLTDFLKLSRLEIAKIVQTVGKPRCVVIMLDGTRRLLKLDPKYQDDSWPFYKNQEKYLIHKSFWIADLLFDMGIEMLIGPLASTGNLYRKNFLPYGLLKLLQPFSDPYPVSVLKKHSVKVSFYGDLQSTYDMKAGDRISRYIKKITKLSSKNPRKHMLIGVGYSTDVETEIISTKAIEYYLKFKKKPSINQLKHIYFGFEALPIDIFIRTNELRPSGGLTPLLTTHGTQMYFPVSPGILSLNEQMIRNIIYDYLFCRVISLGKHQHTPLTPRETNEIKDFYFNSKNVVLGLGKRIGDVWISKEDKKTVKKQTSKRAPA